MATFCSTSSTEVPAALMSRMAWNMSSTTVGASPSEGSSSSSSLGRLMRARAIATICCCPPESDPAGLCSFCFSAGNSASTRSSDAARCAFASGRKLPSARLSCTLIAVNRRRPSGTIAIPWAQNRWLASCVMSRPSKRSWPARARCRPAITLISVLLPAPLGPTTHTSSPRSTCNDTSHSAGAAPYAACTFTTSSMGRLSQVGTHHIGVAHHFARLSLRDQLAVVQHHDAVRQRHHRAHHVLDEDDGGALVADATDQLDGVVDLAGRQAREHLVQQHQARPGRQRARQLQELALVQVE